jgi:hypothetical protein
MLPILRVIPVGGVLLAITILILALNPPGEPHTNFSGLPASGPLIARELHPEWPQFLMLAALRRAEELNRLRQLPGMPVRGAPPEAAPKAEQPPAVAAVPTNRDDAQPEDVTGSVVQSPGAALPVDIGETSSTELPVIPQDERPPVITPERAKRPRESNAAPETTKPEPNKPQRRARRVKPVAKQQAATELNFFEKLFGAGDGPATKGQPASPSAQ